MHHHCRATAPPSSSPSRSPHARLSSDRVTVLTAPPRHHSTLQYTPSCLLTPSPTSARTLHRGARRRQGSGDLLVTGSTPLHSPRRVGLAPLSGLPKTAPYHRVVALPEHLAAGELVALASVRSNPSGHHRSTRDAEPRRTRPATA